MELLDFEKILVIIALLLAFALWSGYRQHKRQKRQAPIVRSEAMTKRLKDLPLSSFQLPSAKGFATYPFQSEEREEPLPTSLAVVELVQANEQPYSICLLAISLYKHQRLQKRHYYYVRPPELRITRSHKGIKKEDLQQACTFEELWSQGLQSLLKDYTLLSFHGNQTIGAILHALAVYGIAAPPLSFISVVPLVKEQYKLKSYTFASVCEAFSLPFEEEDLSSQTQSLMALVKQIQEDRDHATVPIHYVK